MYRQRSTGWMKHWDFILLDLIALHLSFVIAYWVRHGIANPYLRQEYQEISLVLLCTDLIILFFMESLRGVIYRGYWKELVKCVQSAVLITLVTTWYLFSIKAGAEYSRLVCYMTGGFYVIFNYGFRIGWKHVLKNRGMSRPGTVMLVAGERESIGSVLESLEKIVTVCRKLLVLCCWMEDLKKKSPSGTILWLPTSGLWKTLYAATGWMS